ncbi:hypothetical protein QF032_000056 [Streptomyces achromogenes]|uniref:hypothetical protein n=1 Tax=Streptomyces achromogenes TaxID=67255 RepID=UPI00278A70C7|nr:hypothetical protein [Streptomyces achromogenes]MDQ0828212.1 hypothetical protein [Streptomyces achromogenes]
MTEEFERRHCDHHTNTAIRDGRTLYTCTTPCTLCGHPGHVHRDWYTAQYGAGLCRRYHPDQAGYRHDYQPTGRDAEK